MIYCSPHVFRCFTAILHSLMSVLSLHKCVRTTSYTQVATAAHSLRTARLDRPCFMSQHTS